MYVLIVCVCVCVYLVKYSRTLRVCTFFFFKGMYVALGCVPLRALGVFGSASVTVFVIIFLL